MNIKPKLVIGFLGIVIISLFWIFLIVPSISNEVPELLIMEQRGEEQLVSSYGVSLPEPFPIEEITTQTVINEKNNIVDIDINLIATNLATSEIIFDYSEIHSYNKFTHLHDNKTQEYYNFPTNVKKESYFSMVPFSTVSANYHFKQTDKIFDLDIYQFTCESKNNDLTGAYPQLSPHTIFIDYQCNVWIEPKTGNIVYHDLTWESHFIENGVRTLQAEKGGKKTTAYSVNILVENTKKQLDLLFIYEIVIPIFLVIILLSILMIYFMVNQRTNILLEKLKLENQMTKKQLAIEEEQKERELFKEKSKSIQEIQRINKELSYFKSALDVSALVAVTDANGTITYANDMFCKISKYSREELLGKNHRVLKSGYHNIQFYEELWGVITSGDIWYGDICNKAKDGSLYWVRSTILPILDDNGKPKQYIAIRTNITSQIELTKKLVKSERLSSIGELSARLAHDLRNPLSVIKNSQRILRETKDNPESFERTMNRTDRAIDRMIHQINNVMDFIKDSPLKLESTSLLEFINSIISEMNISDEIKINLPSNDVTIQGDKVKLDSLFSNVIRNAIQAMENKGTITIRISEKPDNLVEIEIEDDGPAISKENLDSIFEPLFTTKQVGTGLGLASCKRIAEQHGGTISVTNDPVIFKIVLPISAIDK